MKSNISRKRIMMDIDKLYTDYYKLVSYYVSNLSQLVPTEQHEDLCQECWEHIIKYQDSFDEDKSPHSGDNAIRAWLLMLVKTKIYQIARANNTDKRKIINFIDFNSQDILDK